MPNPIARGGRLQPDTWQWVTLAEGEAPESVRLPDGPLAVPLALWKARRDELLARSTPLGVRLETADDPVALEADLARLALIAIDFPKFTDGRGYSIAWLLRRRLGYRGELRAIGDVLRDQVFYLARSGFDAFQLKDGKDPQGALDALRDFTVTYQAAADGRAPSFRNREAVPR